jgi:large subunit ribosomal protein L15
MVFIHQLSPKKGATHKKKRIGTGQASGHGQTSTRGQKGQRARSGDGKMVGFEGGQMPLLRRLPKRGFNNRLFKKSYEVVNISTLEKNFNSGEDVNPQILKKKGIIKKDGPVKILGNGKLSKKLNVLADSFSKSAKEIIEKAGGSFTAHS